MRKLWIVALALAAVMAVTGVALAANQYQVHLARGSKSVGSLKNPQPTKLDFGYRVTDTENKRPYVIREYRIAAEGTRSYPKARPRCTFAAATDPNITDPAQLSSACRKAKVGVGTIANLAGAPPPPDSNRDQKLPCNVKLTLINISTGDPRFPKTVSQIKKRGGIAIRIDADPPDCPISVHEALAAPFYDTKLEGIPTTELRFTVPDTLAHPGGLDNAVVEVTSRIQNLTGKVPVKNGKPVAAGNASASAKKKTVGFYSNVGRKGKTRTVRVTFIDESGAKNTAKTTFPK
jgi:hypothetical protein